MSLDTAKDPSHMLVFNCGKRLDVDALAEATGRPKDSPEDVGKHYPHAGELTRSRHKARSADQFSRVLIEL